MPKKEIINPDAAKPNPNLSPAKIGRASCRERV